MSSTALARQPGLSDVAFGSLIDLAMVRTGAVSVEVCEACSTINLGAARFCKGCSHKLPAFYAEQQPAGDPAEPPAKLRTAPRQGHAWTWGLAAFWLVINSLAGATAFGISW
jgi:hypothetical protein